TPSPAATSPARSPRDSAGAGSASRSTPTTWPAPGCASTSLVAPRAIPQQGEVPGEAVFQVGVDLAQPVDFVGGDAAAVTQVGRGLAQRPRQAGQAGLQLLQAAVEGFAVEVLGDAPEAAGVGEGQLVAPALVVLLQRRAGQEGEQ